MRDEMLVGKIELRANGRLWGTLHLQDGRLLLECRRQDRFVRFDLLASVEKRRPITDEIVRIHAQITTP